MTLSREFEKLESAIERIYIPEDFSEEGRAVLDGAIVAPASFFERVYSEIVYKASHSRGRYITQTVVRAVTTPATGKKTDFCYQGGMAAFFPEGVISYAETDIPSDKLIFVARLIANSEEEIERLEKRVLPRKEW